MNKIPLLTVVVIFVASSCRKIVESIIMKKYITAARLLCCTMCLFIFFSCQKRVSDPALTTDVATVSQDITIAKLQVKGLSGPNSSTYPITNLTDGKLNTVWSAETAPGVFLPNPNSQIVTFRLDTTVMQTVSYLKIAFFTAGSTTIKYNFDVQVSPDGNTGWVTVLYNQFSAGNAVLQTFDFPDTRGRYVRIVGHGNSGTYPKANSYTEVEIYGGASAAQTSAKVGIGAAQVTAFNTVSGFPAGNAVDGSLNTNWASKRTGTTDYSYLTADLGAVVMSIW